MTLLPDGMAVGVALLLLLASVLGSMISASLGAGGGLLLIVIMAGWMPATAIIPVHGLVQLGSNCGRSALTWRHIDWKVIAAFAPGVVIGASLGAWLLVDLPAQVWQLTIALFVLCLCWGPKLPTAALGAPGIVIASAFTSFVSLFVGASGPLVAAFIKQIHRDRFSTIATFSTAMALQHAPKALVFGLTGFLLSDWLVFIVAMVGCGFLGTWFGLRLLKNFSNQRFGTALNMLLTVLALRLLWQAAAGAW